MLKPGQPIPEASIWVGPNERRTIADLLDGSPALFLFYLFDWSST